MARQKITIQPASEAELANITHWYQETGLPPVGDTDAGIVNATFRDAHRSGLLGSALVRVVVATRRSHHRDAGGPPGGLIDRFYAKLLADHQSPSAENGRLYR